MPVGKLKNGREETTLVFDTWANVGYGVLLVHWASELSDGETSLLGQLATALGYLGRSESWVEAELIAEQQVRDADFNAFPHRDGTRLGKEYEQIALMAAIPDEEYRRWQQQQAEIVLAQFPLPEGRRKPTAKLLKDREWVVAPYPSDLLSCLTKDTIWWKQHGWSQPPGSRQVLYWRRSNTLQVGVPQWPRFRKPKRAESMLLALTTPSGARSSLPPRRRTLPQAELFHRSVVGLVGKGHRVWCPELTGKDEYGTPLIDHHSHAHIVPLDLDDDGHLDHIFVYATMGLGEAAQSAIRGLRETWSKGSGDAIQLAVVGSGDFDTFRRMPGRLRHHVERLLGPVGGSRVWEGITPFVPVRFLKRRGKNCLVGQVNAELASRLLPEAQSVDVDGDLTRALRHYVRRRSHGRASPPVEAGFGLRLTFATPVRGPLMLGYASHYGLGVFGARPDAAISTQS
jgi:CRISPR-associated protein Csb2